MVAQEIKKLAKQTASATNNADEKLRWMQSKTTETMVKIKQISDIMDEANHSVNTIAAAVEEQSASTKVIAENMAQASEGALEVSENIARSARASEKLSERVSNMRICPWVICFKRRLPRQLRPIVRHEDGAWASVCDLGRHQSPLAGNKR